MQKKWMLQNRVDPKEAVFIGDTVHDFETASAVGCRSILVSNGHQNYDRLKSAGAEVVRDISDVLSFL